MRARTGGRLCDSPRCMAYSFPAWHFAHQAARDSHPHSWPPHWEPRGAPEGIFGLRAMPRRRARRRRASPAHSGGSRSPQGPPTWEARIPLPAPLRRAGQPRTDRQRSRSPARRHGAAHPLRGFYLLAPTTDGLHVAASSHVDSPTDPSVPGRQHYLLALSTDELHVIAALRYAAGDIEGSFDARSARGISVSSGYGS